VTDRSTCLTRWRSRNYCRNSSTNDLQRQVRAYEIHYLRPFCRQTVCEHNMNSALPTATELHKVNFRKHNKSCSRLPTRDPHPTTINHGIILYSSLHKSHHTACKHSCYHLSALSCARCQDPSIDRPSEDSGWFMLWALRSA
jgi:hypothetical protein